MFGSLLTITESADQVQANTSGITSAGVSGTVYAGVEFNTSGAELRNDGPSSTSFTTSRGSWLNSGSASAVWIERILNSGTLDWEDPGAGRFQLNASRKYGVSRATNGLKVANVTFNFYDASSGGNLLDSVTYPIDVERGAL